MLKVILNVFSSISDYRVLGRSKYALSDILFIVFIGVIVGGHGWKVIHNFAVTKLYWFQKFLPNIVIPSVDTLSRTISKLDPKELMSGFVKLGKVLLGQSPRTKIKPGRPIKGAPRRYFSLDGKTIRGAIAPGESKSKVHIVNAVCGLLTLAVLKVRGKSNEITAFPLILETLASLGLVAGSAMTVDAMGCQKSLADQILNSGRTFCLALKETSLAF